MNCPDCKETVPDKSLPMVMGHRGMYASLLKSPPHAMYQMKEIAVEMISIGGGFYQCPECKMVRRA